MLAWFRKRKPRMDRLLCSYRRSCKFRASSRTTRRHDCLALGVTKWELGIGLAARFKEAARAAT